MLLAVACVGLLACGQSREEYLQTRAASDFRCDRESVRVESRGSGRFRAVGCAQEANYACMKQGIDFTCVRDP
jgi:hypothetical protein